MNPEQLLKSNGSLKIPPPAFLEMGGEFVSLDPKTETAEVRFPVQERYENPLGYMQGGFLAAAVDNTIGPLSFLVAPPSVTKTMTMTYHKPVSAEMSHIIVRAQKESLDGRKLWLTAQVFDANETLLADCRALQIVL